MKAKTWLGRGEDYDLTDFRFLIARRERTSRIWYLRLGMEKNLGTSSL